MFNKLDNTFLLIEDSIDDKKLASDVKMKKYDSDLDNIKTLFKQELVHNQFFSSDKMY